MRSLIIGASSHAGVTMCDYLHKIGEDFLGTKLPTESVTLNDAQQICNMDLLDPTSIQHVLADYAPDCIFNFAAQSSVHLAWKNPGLTVDVNVNGALNLFEAIRNMEKKPIVVLIGAGEEYGRVSFLQIPITESETVHPCNLYAATKSCQTMLAQIYHQAYGLKLIIARTFNMIGPGQSDRFVISDLCKQAIEIEKGMTPAILHVGNINIQRDFTDIRDLVEAFWLLSQKGRPGEIYNVGRGKAIRIQEVIANIQQMIAPQIEVKVERSRMRPNDIPKLEADVTKVYADTGWTANTPLQKSIADILQYWRTNL